MLTVVTFQGWVSDLIRNRFGTATALAKAIGMELSPFTRGVAAGTLNVLNLLRLAQVADAPASMVLRLAGKREVADLLDQLYGQGGHVVTASEADHLRKWRSITARARSGLDVILTDLLPPDAPAAGTDAETPRRPRDLPTHRIRNHG